MRSSLMTEDYLHFLMPFFKLYLVVNHFGMTTKILGILGQLYTYIFYNVKILTYSTEIFVLGGKRNCLNSSSC